MFVVKTKKIVVDLATILYFGARPQSARPLHAIDLALSLKAEAVEGKECVVHVFDVGR
jgi:hypothetical protein